jgi:hypothetical protein
LYRTRPGSHVIPHPVVNMIGRLVNGHSCLLLAAHASDSSGATTYHRRLCFPDPNRSDSDTHVCCLARDSSECLQHCSHRPRLHHSQCVVNDGSRGDSGYTDCHAGLFDCDDHSLVIAVTPRCFVAAAHLATHCSFQAGLAAASRIVSRRSYNLLRLVSYLLVLSKLLRLLRLLLRLRVLMLRL